ncbi:MAG: hypothetical protein LBC86_10420 [Oscillospiraceae bacterium]|nr:hypothetical protein [Oscillospiraceae bacterium]
MVKAKIEQYKQNGDKIILTRDTHGIDYYNTQEGRLLPKHRQWHRFFQ